MGRRDRGPRRLWPELRFLVLAQVGRREFRRGLGWSVVASREWERPVGMLRMMGVVRRLRRLRSRALVLVRLLVQGRFERVEVVIFEFGAQETAGVTAPAKTKKATANA